MKIRSQGLAVALGAGLLFGSAWCFEQAWEARGRKRPRVARWLAV